MKKIRCLVSAGPTREHFDPVRFISNPSTGKMGVGIARECAALGWDTFLALGPTQLENPKGVETQNVVSADEMFESLSARFEGADILIMCAAVSDMKPKARSAGKVKKSEMDFCPEFEPTVDILKTLSARKKSQILIGFAAETENLEAYAKKKLEEKNLDAIAANRVCAGRGGFASDENELLIFFKGGQTQALPMAGKDELAKALVKLVSARFF